MVAPQPPPTPAAPIKVADLAAPTLPTLGLPTAETMLGGPLWANGAPPGLELLLARLPTAIADPTLLTLQRALLTAPGPADGPPELLLARIDRLLAMAEPAAAQQLLELVPEGAAGPEVAVRRLRAALAAGHTQPACEAAQAQAALTPPWPAARIVCAALANDAAAVQLDLDLLESRGEPIDPTLAGLARAAAAGGRFTLPSALPDDPLLLPLLRMVPLEVDPGTVAALPIPARRALADNPALPAAARAAAAGPPRPGPSVRPELAGNTPGDWAASTASVPAAQRARWLALADGLGLAVPDPIWDELYRTEPADPGPAPDLALWRGFEVARIGEQRGGRSAVCPAAPRRPPRGRGAGHPAPGAGRAGRAWARRAGPLAGGRHRWGVGSVSAMLDAFLEMMAAERGSARHTLDAYRRDLADFRAFLAKCGGTLPTAGGDDIRAYLAQLADAGLLPSTTARRLAAIRQYYRFLFLEGGGPTTPPPTSTRPSRAAACPSSWRKRRSRR